MSLDSTPFSYGEPRFAKLYILYIMQYGLSYLPASKEPKYVC